MLKYCNYLLGSNVEEDNSTELNTKLDCIPAFAMKLPITDASYYSHGSTNKLWESLKQIPDSDNFNMLVKSYYINKENVTEKDTVTTVKDKFLKDFNTHIENLEYSEIQIAERPTTFHSGGQSYAELLENLQSDEGKFNLNRFKTFNVYSNYMYLAEAATGKILFCLMIKKEYIPLLQYMFLLNKDITTCTEAFELWVDSEFSSTSYEFSSLRSTYVSSIKKPLEEAGIQIVEKDDLTLTLVNSINIPEYSTIEEEHAFLKSEAAKLLSSITKNSSTNKVKINSKGEKVLHGEPIISL